MISDTFKGRPWIRQGAWRELLSVGGTGASGIGCVSWRGLYTPSSFRTLSKGSIMYGVLIIWLRTIENENYEDLHL